jgi:outer membrane receptor for monomeric catechols
MTRSTVRIVMRIGLIVCVLQSLSVCRARTQGAGDVELVIAAFVHRFMQFVEWPRDASQELRYQGGSPRHQARLHRSMDLTSGVQLDLLVRHVSRLAALSIPAYTEANARVAWQVTDELQFHLSGQNLLQEHHAEWIADRGSANVEIERTFLAGLTWRR